MTLYVQSPFQEPNCDSITSVLWYFRPGAYESICVGGGTFFIKQVLIRAENFRMVDNKIIA